jgi:hypothetical protein
MPSAKLLSHESILTMLKWFFDMNICVVVSYLNREKWHNQLVISAMSMESRDSDTDDMYAGVEPTFPTIPDFQRKYWVFLSIAFT